MSELFKCSRCNKEFTTDKFKVVNNVRSKNCLECLKFKSDWQKKKVKLNKDFKYDEKEWIKHPIYSGYAANKTGYVLNINTKNIIGKLKENGYIDIMVANKKMYLCHRFIWECFNGVITDKKLVVCHIDNNKSNNAISNLKLDTQTNNLKDAFNDGVKKPAGGKIKKSVVATNLTTNKVKQYKSMNEASKKIKKDIQ